jgi:hypothetical protein
VVVGCCAVHAARIAMSREVSRFEWVGGRNWVGGAWIGAGEPEVTRQRRPPTRAMRHGRGVWVSYDTVIGGSSCWWCAWRNSERWKRKRGPPGVKERWKMECKLLAEG